ncbi:Major Facilitator Superfamily protein [Nocardioides terrae]|uniref:Major Facilitator Superfamily protein n=1 Tax=Nocardioides terrae TaxID=574651 RepID=A0A1I1JPG3_9ACTN|nr:MFS transporter [Nocardioides terrae]SFC50509.1 Major Facilitator Superfamily protein [Nocardioides terrae]
MQHEPSGATDAEIASHTSTARARLELFVVGLGALVVSLAQSLLIPVLGELPGDLHTSASTVSWLLTSTLLVGAVSVPIMGRLGDMFGKRLLLLVAVGSLVAGSLLTAVTSNVALLIAGRAIQGVSAAAIPLGISLLAGLLPRERVGSAVALISAMLGVGGALGLPLAGFVAEHADFHALFWITAGVGVVAFVGILTIVPESPNRSGGHVDVVGAVLLGAGLVALLLPLSESSSWGWGSAKVWGLLATSAVLLVAFGWSQTRIREPLVDLKAVRRKPIVLANLASILFGFALFASFIGTAAYVEAPEQTGYGFASSLLVGGLVMLPSGLMMLVFAPVAARLISRRGAPQTLAIGAAIVALGFLSRITVHDHLWQIIVGSTIIGVGTGIGYAALPSIINANTPVHELAAANGLNSLFRSLGSSLASAIGGSLLAGKVIMLGDFALPSLGAYQELFALCGVAAVLAAVVALGIPHQRVPLVE